MKYFLVPDLFFLFFFSLNKHNSSEKNKIEFLIWTNVQCIKVGFLYFLCQFYLLDKYTRFFYFCLIGFQFSIELFNQYVHVSQFCAIERHKGIYSLQDREASVGGSAHRFQILLDGIPRPNVTQLVNSQISHEVLVQTTLFMICVCATCFSNMQISNLKNSLS